MSNQHNHRDDVEPTTRRDQARTAQGFAETNSADADTHVERQYITDFLFYQTTFALEDLEESQNTLNATRGTNFHMARARRMRRKTSSRKY